jgi:hypothetical protein
MKYYNDRQEGARSDGNKQVYESIPYHLERKGYVRAGGGGFYGT